VFFGILGKLTERLKSTKDPQEAKTILKALHWNFKSRDFKLLNEKLQIFDLLYRGNGDKDSVIGSNFNNYFLQKANTLSKDLLFTFEDAFLAVVARITDTEPLQTLQLKNRGQTSVASLFKSQSIVEVDVSEHLISQAFNVMFKMFHTYLKTAKALSNGLANDENLDFDENDVFSIVREVLNKNNPKKSDKADEPKKEEAAAATPNNIIDIQIGVI